MPRRPRTDKTTLTTRIAGRCSPDEKRGIHDKAEAAGITTSRFMIYAALGHPIRSIADLKVLNELRRLGGLVRHDHNLVEGYSRPFSPERAALMGEIREAIRRIAQEIHTDDPVEAD
jgi:uncharacterized protein (DUF1778 family)